MATELLDWLLRSTLALSLAILAVLALRSSWRRAFGAGSGLWLWLLLPAALLATSLPRPVAIVAPSTLATMESGPAAPDASTGARVPQRRAGPGASDDAGLAPARDAVPMSASLQDVVAAWARLPQSGVLLAPWLAGALALAGVLAWQQRRFRRRLGVLRLRADGSFGASSDRIGPAVIGALRPRIVVPADFERRYDAEQRALVLAHERVHLRRGDLQVNLLLSALRCVFWFNPLVHLASSRLRLDQELACDAAVLRRHPSAGRAYATALLNTQLADLGLPVGCHWQSSQPLKWRIAMLKQTPTGPMRLWLGAGLALLASSATAVTVWQAQPAHHVVGPGAAAPVRAALPAAFDRLVVATAPVAVAAPRIEDLPAPVAPRPVDAPRAAMAAPVAPGPLVAPSAQLRALVAPQPLVAPAPMPAPQPAPAIEATPAVEAAPVAMPEPALEARPATVAPDVAARLMPPRVSRIWLADVPVRRKVAREKEGKLVVQVHVDADGKPGAAAVVHNELGPAYEASALRAVRRWQFDPATRDGVAVASTVLVPVAFDLRQERYEDFWNDAMRHQAAPGMPRIPPSAGLNRPPAKS